MDGKIPKGLSQLTWSNLDATMDSYIVLAETYVGASASTILHPTLAHLMPD